MRRILLRLTITLSALIVCSGLITAQSSSKPDSSMIADGSGIARLTTLLLGQWHAPVCGVTPPPGDFLWYEGGDYCEWTTTNRGTLGAQRDAQHRVHVIRLDRQTTGEANARAIVDSIGTTLRTSGLAYRDCGVGSTPAGETRAWLYARGDLVFYVSEITPSSAPPRLIALAVDNPRGFPEALCRASAPPPAMKQGPNPNSAYPRNDIPVTLPSGTVVHVRNVVVLNGKNDKSLTLYIETPTPQDQPNRLASEAMELVNRWSDFSRQHNIDRVMITICRTQACLETREITAEMFRFDRQPDGSWKAEPLTAESKSLM
jgi:hypothetical protein